MKYKLIIDKNVEEEIIVIRTDFVNWKNDCLLIFGTYLVNNWYSLVGMNMVSY